MNGSQANFLMPVPQDALPPTFITRSLPFSGIVIWLSLCNLRTHFIDFRFHCRIGVAADAQLVATILYLNILGGFITNWLGLRVDPGSGLEIDESSRNFQTSARVISSSTSDGILGGFGVALTAAFTHPSLLTSDLCRPLAAHCIGYPVITLGFGLRTYFRSVVQFVICKKQTYTVIKVKC